MNINISQSVAFNMVAHGGKSKINVEGSTIISTKDLNRKKVQDNLINQLVDDNRIIRLTPLSVDLGCEEIKINQRDLIEFIGIEVYNPYSRIWSINILKFNRRNITIEDLVNRSNKLKHINIDYVFVYSGGKDAFWIKISSRMEYIDTDSRLITIIVSMDHNIGIIDIAQDK